jgi:hypothetical protein
MEKYVGAGDCSVLSLYFVEIFAGFLSTEKASRRRQTNQPKLIFDLLI